MKLLSILSNREGIGGYLGTEGIVGRGVTEMIKRRLGKEKRLRNGIEHLRGKM